MRNTLLIILIGSLIILNGCIDRKDIIDNQFDRKVMLENIADHVIIPSYEHLLGKTLALEAAVQNFILTTDIPSLERTQNAWIEVYEAWQYANAFNFGPAGEQGLRKTLLEEIGTFPVSETKLNNILTSGFYNLNDFNRDARGFLAIEYVLFDLENNQEKVINAYLASANRKQFTLDLTLDIKSRVSQILDQWNSGYRDTFISNSGTDVGSSTSQLYNEFVKSFESIKNFKLGLPLGLRPGQIQPEPARVEAYYSGESRRMLATHFRAITFIWHGKNQSGQDFIGFDDYLKSVVGGEALIDATQDQIAVINNAIDGVPELPKFSVQIVDNPSPLENLHEQLQRHTRFFKSDMSSLLGISITFSSGDGD